MDIHFQELDIHFQELDIHFQELDNNINQQLIIFLRQFIKISDIASDIVEADYFCSLLENGKNISTFDSADKKLIIRFLRELNIYQHNNNVKLYIEFLRKN